MQQRGMTQRKYSSSTGTLLCCVVKHAHGIHPYSQCVIHAFGFLLLLVGALTQSRVLCFAATFLHSFLCAQHT